MSRYVAAVVLVATCMLVGCGGPDEEPQTATTEATEQGATEEDVEPTDEAAPETAEDFVPLERRPVTLYFPAAFDDGLATEESEIFETAAPGDLAKQIIADLISGPNHAYVLRVIPQRTVLRQIFVLPDGTAWADFNEELRLGLGGGATRERLLVYSIVNSLALNIREIRRVGLLIDGRQIETLSGHLDLRYPLPADTTMVLEVPEKLRGKGTTRAAV